MTTGVELWKTDGTTSGTKIVKDINVGSGDAFEWSLNQYHHSIGDTLFFIADDGTHGIELWRTNGTSSGTNAEIARMQVHQYLTWLQQRPQL